MTDLYGQDAIDYYIDQAREERCGVTEYAEFLDTKVQLAPSSGITVKKSSIRRKLFPFQRDLTAWAVRKGRAALFADTGLGKTFMQVEWARLIGERTLIIAPLSVAQQTVGEAQKLRVKVHYTRSGDDLTDGINITNYEMVSKFDPADFGAVVLDESSILKSLDGKTRAKLCEMFADTPYRLCCTATPAPNDITELANHAEFLGVSTRANMLSAFFVHDSNELAKGGWRLKGHAEQSFYRWLSSWAMSVRKPSDLGYDDDGFILPDLDIVPEWVKSGYVPEGMLFPVGLKGITDRSNVRRETLQARVERTAALVNSTGDQWIVWCGLNDEGRELAKIVPDGVLVEGSQSVERKEQAIVDFREGRARVLITKPKIAGMGLNLQNCHKMAFLGLSDSWEAYYQCIRRCWRFGQESDVSAHVVLSDAEEPIYANVQRKEVEAKRMAESLIEHVKDFEKQELSGNGNRDEYETEETEGDGYRLMLGDSVERLKELDDESIDLSIFSPPFLSLYTYSPTERDLGNSQSPSQFYDHFRYIVQELLRVTKPGRNVACHVAQVPATVVHDGYTGMKDFRGRTIEAFERDGFIYHGEVCIDKDPQAQAIRTHSKGLLFVQLRKDSSWLRPAFADYILVFRKPGENAVPIQPDITNDQWIEWARPVWYGIRESDTLNVAEGRADKDERHIAPLQLGTIERCVRLWSNEGETVLSPFAGIGSEGYVALQQSRRFVGIELKRSYYEAARRNLAAAKSQLALPV